MARPNKINTKQDQENTLRRKYFKKLGLQLIENHEFGRPIPTEENISQLYPLALKYGDFYLIARVQKIRKILCEKTLKKCN